MAGTLSADYIQPQSNTGLTILTPAGGTIASVNIGGIYSATGNLLISSSFNGLVANTGISGLIINDQIASVANTKITGTINSNQLGSNVAQFNGMKNRIINGAMVIDQRNAGASVTATTSGLYTVDRWYAQATVNSKYTVQQNAGAVTPPVGFSNYLGATSSAATALAAGDYYCISQGIEGFNIADLAWGTANAKTVTLSFQVYSSQTGTFGGSLWTGNSGAYVPFSYSILIANTWTNVSVTIAGPTIGSWYTNNSNGVTLNFSLGAGATYSGGTAGTWSSTIYVQPSGCVNIINTSGATFYITGVQLEVGSSATGYEYRQYGTELALCQRYYYGLSGSGIPIMIGQAYSTSAVAGAFVIPTEMRAIPILSYNSLNAWTSTGSTSGATTWTIDSGSSNKLLRIGASGGSGLVAGNASGMYLNGASAYFNLSAEL